MKTFLFVSATLKNCRRMKITNLTSSCGKQTLSSIYLSYKGTSIIWRNFKIFGPVSTLLWLISAKYPRFRILRIFTLYWGRSLSSSIFLNVVNKETWNIIAYILQSKAMRCISLTMQWLVCTEFSSNMANAKEVALIIFGCPNLWKRM